MCKVGMVEGVCVEGIFLDTGCSQILVRKGCVSKVKLLSQRKLTCIHGENVSYPLAMVKMGSDGRKFLLKAELADDLLVPVLMGTDVEVIWKIIHSAMLEEEKTSLPVTRVMKRTE